MFSQNRPAFQYHSTQGIQRGTITSSPTLGGRFDDCPRREFFEIDPAQAIAILKLLHVEDATAEIQQQTDPIPSEDHTAAQQFLNRRPNFIFPEMGIPLGATIHFTNADITAEIIGPRKVRCQGEESSLTAATRRILGLGYHVNPCRYWTYNGRNLNTLYDETYTIVR